MNKTFQTFSFSGKSINCYGLEIVKRALKKYSYTFKEFSIESNYPVLFSVYWPEQIYDFVKWRYRFGMKDKKIIVGGNVATTNPSSLIGFDTSCYIGDGEIWNGDLSHPNIIDKTTQIPVEKAVSEYIIPLYYEDIQTNRRAFCEMSRGCINKCLFCQYGWLKKYREADIIDIKQIIKKSTTKAIRMFAADRFQHSRYIDIRRYMEKSGKCDTGSDVSLRFLLKKPEYLNYTKKVRIGIEGMSERLRTYIGKANSDKKIIKFCKMVVDAGIRCLDWYMIYGLPSECEEDVKEFRNLLKQLDEALPIGYTIAIHWNAFTPSPQTPFQWMKPAFNYDKTALKRYIFSEDRLNKRIKLMHKPKFTSNDKLFLRALAGRASIETKDIIYSVSKNKNKYLKNKGFVIREYEKQMNANFVEKWPLDIPLPWDKYVIYPKEKMKKIITKKYFNI